MSAKTIKSVSVVPVVSVPVTKVSAIGTALQAQIAYTIATNGMRIKRQGAYAEAAKALKSFKPVAAFESQDKLKARITSDLTKDGFITAVTTKLELGRMLRATVNGLYREWAIYGSVKKGYAVDTVKLAKRNTKDNLFDMEMFSSVMKSIFG